MSAARVSGEALKRVGIASTAAVGMTVLCLLGVRGLTKVQAPPEATASVPLERSVPLAPPPPPTEPTPTELTDLTTPASSQADASDVAPPPVAPPALAGLAPSAGPGTLALGPIGGLPSVAGLPASGVEDLDELAEDGPATPARATSRPPAEYPAIAQRRGLEGYVTLRLRIDDRGRVIDAVVVEAKPKGVFDSAAKRAVRRYRFSPARAGTKPVASTLQQTIRFELDR